jgi:hypothetical protein
MRDRKVLAVGSLLFASACFAQSLYPITPYTRAPDKQALQVHRTIADETRWIRDFKPTSSTSSVTAYELRFGYVSTGRGSRLKSALDGDVNGVPTHLRLGNIEEISVTDRSKTSATLRVIVFPTLNEDALLRLHPSYTTLRTDYRSTITMVVKLTDDTGADLCLFGTSSSDADETDMTCKVLLKVVTLNKAIELRYLSPEVWWATLSVFSDASYPYTDTKSTSSYAEHAMPK